MKRNESDAGHRIAVTRNGHADALAPPTFPCEPATPFTPRPRSRRARRKSGPTIVICSRRSPISASPDAVSLQLDSLRGARLTRHMCIDPQREELIREELGRIVASDLFCRSDRLCRFLRFSVEQALRGESDRVKEYVVAVEAYGRPASFDSRVDPVVRVEARRLRDRLKTWYEGEGRNARIRIDLPRGRYAALFHDPPASAPKHKPAPAQRTMAVLPLANLNAGPENDYLCDGLTEELIHSLTKVRELRVVAWNSAARMKGREQDLEAIREQLGVETILRGSIRCLGDRLRITAQLIESASGYYLWSETWDRSASDVFAIEEEIAQAIVNTLRVQLWPESTTRLTPKATNIECYNAYLKGRFHWNKRSPEGLRLGLRCFEDAVALDPQWALGWAGLGDSFAVLAENGLLPQETAIPAANRAAERATSLDPNLAEAHATLGLLRSRYDWKWDEAAVFFRRAIDLNPGYATAHFWYGFHYLAMTGRLEEALAEAELAVSLDPLSVIAQEGRGFVLMVSRRYEEAIEQYRLLLEFEPSFYKAWTSRGRVYAQMGDYARAIEMYEKGLQLGGTIANILAALGQAHALNGEKDRARELLQQLHEMSSSASRAGSGTSAVPATCFAIVHLGLGENDRALEWLEAGIERRQMSLSALKVHPVYDPVRQEPRFQALLVRLGLSQASLNERSEVNSTGTLRSA
jgi:TolB-like protein/Tfp pilus assembly protein PilF